MGLSILVETQFTVQECCSCGVQFAMTAELDRRRVKDHQTFWCPNGHQQSYYAKSPEEKLRDELALVRRHWAEESAARQKAERAQIRLEKRAQAGMCSECKRTFPNYARHMATKHSKVKVRTS